MSANDKSIEVLLAERARILRETADRAYSESDPNWEAHEWAARAAEKALEEARGQ